MKQLITSFLVSLFLVTCAFAQSQEIPSPWVSDTPSITAGSYTSGMALGGIRQLTSALCTGYKTGYLTAITDVDFDNQLASIDFWFFDTQPTGTYNDHGTVTLSQADLNKSIGFVHLDSLTDLSSLSGNGQLHKGSLAEPVRTVSGINVFVLPVIKGSATFTHSNAHQFKFAFACDMKTVH